MKFLKFFLETGYRLLILWFLLISLSMQEMNIQTQNKPINYKSSSLLGNMYKMLTLCIYDSNCEKIYSNRWDRKPKKQ